MLTADGRCTDPRCHIQDSRIYRMVGHCTNCGADGVLMLFSAAHQKRELDCPRCGVSFSVRPDRLAIDDEIPEA